MSFASFNSSSRELFNFICEALFQELDAAESLLANFRGEETDYIRWSQSKVRQNTSVLQRHVNFELYQERRRISKGFTASGNLEWDLIQARDLLKEARLQIQATPEDPFFVEMTNHGSSEELFEGRLASTDLIVETIARASADHDMAGLLTSGSVAVGNRNSKGQSHWFANESFFLDYSLYNGEKAAKGSYAGREWDKNHFSTALNGTADLLAKMSRAPKKLAPGDYRVYLAPGAIAELVPMFSRGALSYQALQSGDCALRKLVQRERSLSPKFSLFENFGLGLSPRFNARGEASAQKVALIQNGQLENMLVSSRTAARYGVPSNQANARESLRAPEIDPGSLRKDHILQELGTGLYLSNLHYVNWSDVQSARVTGMTRYACFWVENGELIAPIEDMRFDVSFFEIFGENLVEVTDFQEMDPEIGTYSERSLGGQKLPGMLIEKFRLTL